MKKFIKKFYSYYCINHKIVIHKNNMKKKVNGVRNKIPDLTVEEISILKDYWCKYNIKPDINTYKWYKHSCGYFDPRFIPEDVYDAYILPFFNNEKRCYGLNDKNLFEIYYGKELMPKTIIRRVNGVIQDGNYNCISFNEALSVIKKYNKVVVKPSVDSCQGMGVKCVKSVDFESIIKNYNSDYVVQELIKQHEELKRFNESSVNVLRITTVMLKSGIEVVAPIIRVGAPGNFTDHFNIAIGIDEKGRLLSKGKDTKGKQVDELPNKERICELKIPCYDKMVTTVKKLHAITPQARIIGWDVCADNYDNIIIIEANFNFPGIVRSQDCCGPLFGNITELILNEVFERK